MGASAVSLAVSTPTLLFSGGKIIHSLKYLQMFKLISLVNIELPDNSYLLLSSFESDPLMFFPNHVKSTSSSCWVPEKIRDNRLFCNFYNSIGGIMELLISGLLLSFSLEFVVFFFDQRLQKCPVAHKTLNYISTVQKMVLLRVLLTIQIDLILAAVINLFYGGLEGPLDFFSYLVIGVIFVVYIGLAVFYYVVSKQCKAVETEIISSKEAATSEEARTHIENLLVRQKTLSSILGLRTGLKGLGGHLNELRIARDFTIPILIVSSFNFPALQILLLGLMLALELVYLTWYRPFTKKIQSGIAIL